MIDTIRYKDKGNRIKVKKNIEYSLILLSTIIFQNLIYTENFSQKCLLKV